MNRSPPVGHFYFGFLVFSEKNSVCRDRTHVPTCQKVTRCRLSYRGRPAEWEENTHTLQMFLFLFLSGVPTWMGEQHNGGFLPGVDPMLLLIPSGDRPV